jgi:protein-S-isoprenylcysteine O-methyltransferase Ste14
MKNDPKLLERRVKGGTVAEKERNQKVIQALASAAFVATIVIPVLDHRFRLTGVPVFVVCFGDSLVVLGFVIVFLVFKENTFTSGVIEVADGQKVISTGPYAIVRHPMYVGALVLLLGAPLALGSWRGLFTIIPMTIVIILRLLNEERFLAKNLPGYREYRTVVRYRLLPLIW